jgi:membrane protein implicated in regulation of membrane protease activity
MDGGGVMHGPLVAAADAPSLPWWGAVLYALVIGLLVAALIALWIEAWRDRPRREDAQRDDD